MLSTMTKQEAAALVTLSRYTEWEQFAGYLRRSEAELTQRLISGASDLNQIGKLQGAVAAVQAVTKTPDVAALTTKT